MGVSNNTGIPKSSILIGFSIINHPFWGTPIFGNTHMSIISYGGVLVMIDRDTNDKKKHSIAALAFPIQ